MNLNVLLTVLLSCTDSTTLTIVNRVQFKFCKLRKEVNHD